MGVSSMDQPFDIPLLYSARMGTNQNIRYRSFSASNGWNSWSKIGEVTGQMESKDCMTCFQIIYSGTGNIVMQCCLEEDGWLSPVHNGETCGDNNRQKRIKAVRIQLVSSPGYHVFYRLLLNSGLWTDWKRDYGVAGDTEGNSFVVAFQIQLTIDEPRVLYRAYIQNHGWSSFVADNQIVGMNGKGLRLEAFYVNYAGPGRLLLQAYVENVGWMKEVSNNVVCGTERQGLRMESIRIRLLNLEGYHVIYCVCIKKAGWQPWVRDGEDAGVAGSGELIEAIRMRIALCIVCCNKKRKLGSRYSLSRLRPPHSLLTCK